MLLRRPYAISGTNLAYGATDPLPRLPPGGLTPDSDGGLNSARNGGLNSTRNRMGSDGTSVFRQRRKV
eukprot:3113173-Rhodomonas_salina.4